MFSFGLKVSNFITTLALILGVLTLTACSGGGSSTNLDSSMQLRDWPTTEQVNGVKSGSYSVIAVDESGQYVDLPTGLLSIRVDDSSVGEIVGITTTDASACDSWYLHLRYNPNETHPVAVTPSTQIADDVLAIGITQIPGEVHIGLAPIGTTQLVNGESELALVEFAHEPFVGSKFVSAVTSSVVDDLHFGFANHEMLIWSYKSTGDYDQNSEVNVADITPIAIHFQLTSSDDNWPAARVADGDGNGEVNATDITPIAINYLNSVSKYRIKAGPTELGPFGQITDSDVLTLEATEPFGGGFLRFEEELANPVDNAYYIVVAMDGENEAEGISNIVQYTGDVPPMNPPQNLAVTVPVDVFHLEWNVPADSIPDSYAVHVANSESLLTTTPAIASSVVETFYNLPSYISTENELYLGVKANYGGDSSEFSNVVHYTPGEDAPVWDALGEGIKSVTPGNAQVTIEWYEATDAVNPPVEYLLYYAPTSVGIDWATHQEAFSVGLTTDITGLINDTSYDFGVRARNNAGASTTNTNFMSATPAEVNDAPIWDTLGEGIKTATPGDMQVAIEWYEATEAVNPPVEYLLFYAPTSIGINWDTHQETHSGGLEKTIEGLANGVSWDFGVRARNSIGATTDNTNLLSATPTGSGGVPVDNGTWQSSELVDDGGTLQPQEVGWYTDIEVAPDGTVGIAHYNTSSQDLLYTFGSAGSWTTETVSSQGDTGLWPNLEYHPTTGHPCIAFHNADAPSLDYATYDGTSWTVETVDGGGDKGAFCDLEFDPADDYPAISYFDAVGQDCKYAKWDGTEWDYDIAYNGVSAGSMNLTGAFTSMEFNPVTGNPGISFLKTYNTGFDMLACWYVEYNGSSWSAEEADLGSAGDIGFGTAGWGTSLAFNPSGVPFILHVDIMNDVRLASKGSGTWTASVVGSSNYMVTPELIMTDIEFNDTDLYWVYYDSSGAADFGMGYGAPTTIESGGKGGTPTFAISSTGVFHAAYLDVTNNDLRYATGDGSSWTAEVANAGGAGQPTVGDKASLCFNPMVGYPMISYYDVSNRQLKYADKQLGGWQKEIVASGKRDGSHSQMGVADDGTAYIAYFYIDAMVAGLRVADGGFGSWDITTIQEANLQGGQPVGEFLSIDMNLSPSNYPGISYYNRATHGLEFALGSNGDSYEQTAIDAFNDPGRWSSAAFNPANRLPGVAYYRRDTGDLFFCERSTGGIWTPEPVDTIQDTGNRCSMDYVTDYILTVAPWISYYDSTNKVLKVAYSEEGEWKFVNIPAPAGSTDYGSYSCLTNHPSHARASVVFYDKSNGKLWYVFIGDPDAPQAAVEIAGADHAEGLFPSLKFHPQSNEPAVAYQDGTNGDLRYVWREAS